MNLEANSHFNINTDDFNAVNKLKGLKKHENNLSNSDKLVSTEFNSLVNCISIPANDINSVDKVLSKYSTINPAMFEDFFAANDVAQAKKLVKGIVTSPNIGEFVDNVNNFYKRVNKMDKSELTETSAFLGEQMRSANGKDEIIGSLLMGVSGELKNRENNQSGTYIFTKDNKFDFKDEYKMSILDF